MLEGETKTRFLRRVDASFYLKANYALQVSAAYLAKLAVVGGGPAFHKAGRWPIYTQAALDQWAIERLGPQVASTAGYGEAA